MHFSEADKTRINNYYDASLLSYGRNSARSLNWTSEYNQQIRFKILSEVGDISGHSVLDVGCGLGDLYGYLKKNFSNFTYKGVDICPKYISEAKIKYPEAEFEIADFGTYKGKKFDFVMASGALSFYVADFKKLYFEYVKKMFEISQIAVAFNMLKIGYFPENSVFSTYQVPEVYNFCAGLTHALVERQDYLKHDFTFYLYHKDLRL